MIRERVSTQGVIRPLECENELDAFQVPPNIIGVLSELAVRRYINGKTHFDRKFAGAIKKIEKHRRRNLEQAKKDTLRNMTQLQTCLSRDGEDSNKGNRKKGIKEGLLAASGSWSWAWALDGDERPPPSSIVSRRDTQEARQLARIADQSPLQEEHSLSGNRLWSYIVDFLTASPTKAEKASQEDVKVEQKSKKLRFWSRV